MALGTFTFPNFQGYLIRSIRNIDNSIDNQFGEVSNRKITILKSQFQCVGKALPEASPFSCAIIFFIHLIFWFETLVNQHLLGNETPLMG
ncbi:MAG: hypothetical protein V7K53_22045 [Nostoc sp.]|uniref:hypothetical protein n=1 Tax=Nostoc sp. TaxID=1180 RepID=UPI002FFD32D8